MRRLKLLTSNASPGFAKVQVYSITVLNDSLKSSFYPENVQNSVNQFRANIIPSVRIPDKAAQIEFSV